MFPNSMYNTFSKSLRNKRPKYQKVAEPDQADLHINLPNGKVDKNSSAVILQDAASLLLEPSASPPQPSSTNNINHEVNDPLPVSPSKNLPNRSDFVSGSTKESTDHKKSFQSVTSSQYIYNKFHGGNKKVPEGSEKPSLAIRCLFPRRALSTIIDDTSQSIPLLEPELGSLEEDVLTCWNRFRGIIAMLAATLLISFNSQILYYVSHETQLHLNYSKSCYLTWSFTFYTLIHAIPLGFIMYLDYEGITKPFRQSRKLVYLILLRGLCGSLILFVIWNAIKYFGKPAPVAVITAMAPIMVYINAYFVLKEKLGIVPILNAVIALVGVVVMNLDSLLEINTHGKPKTNPVTDQTGPVYRTLVGTAIALVAMYLLSWATVLVRLVREVHPILINLSYGVFGIFIMAGVALSTGTMKLFYEWTGFGFCILIASISAVSNYMFTYALKHEQAGVVSLIRTSEVIFQFLYQYLFFGIQPQTFTALGASLVIFGVICISFRKIVIESAEDSKIRRWFFFLKY